MTRPRTDRRLLAACALSLGVTLGCAGCQAAPKRPARINHPVFFTLNDPTDASELIRDCNEHLASIPQVIAYYCGRHIDVGRSSVLIDYDVAAYVGFDSVEDYLAYVEHPAHQALVKKWGPRCASIQVRDVLDESK